MPAPTSLGRRIVLLLRIALAAAAVVALARLVHRGDIGRARSLIGQAGWLLALVPLPTAIAMALDAWGWRAILSTLGQTVSQRRMMELRLSVEALVLALPGGSVAGEAAKAALLQRRGGVPLAVGAASLAITKLLLIATDSAYLLLAALGAAAGGGGGAGGRPAVVPVAVALAGAALTALVTFWLGRALRRSRSAGRLGRWLASLPSRRLRDWMESRQSRFDELDAAARGHFDAPRAERLRCFIPFMLEWLIEGAETWLILRCVGVSLGLGQTLALDAIGSFLRAVVIVVPAGLGIQDAVQIVLLREMGVADPIATGAAFIFIKRTKEVFWIVIGLLFLAVRRDLWRVKPIPETTAGPDSTRSPS